MKIVISSENRRQGRVWQAGLSLPEVMFSIALFTILAGALIYSNLFGLRMYELTQSKLTAGGDAQLAVGRMTDEIRASKVTQVGVWELNNGRFQVVSNNTLQLGDAIRIYPSTNTNSYIVYYMDANENALKRLSSSAGTPVKLAGSVTNRWAFTAQDHLGNVLTNSQNNRVIHMRLDFYQPQSPTPKGSSEKLFDYYKLETSVTRRALE